VKLIDHAIDYIVNVVLLPLVAFGIYYIPRRLHQS